MNKNKKLLLLSAIFVILYIPVNIYLMPVIYNKLIPDNQFSSGFSLDYIIYFIGVIYFFILIFNNKIDLNNHYKGILIWSIIFFLLNIVSGILGFMVYGNLEKSTKRERRELPKIEYKEFTNKYICLFAFIICMVLMFYVSKFVNSFIGIILLYLSIFIIMISVFYKQLIHDFKIFKDYFKEYMVIILKTWIKSLILMIIISLIIQLTTSVNQSNNQQNLQEMFNVYPLFVVLLSVFYAPLAEELMFRGVFRKLIKNKYLFIIVSGVLFGLLHVIDDSKTLAEFSFVIVYSSLGMYLASLYYKTNNLWTNISFHFLQNFLGILGMIALYFAK